MDSFSKFIDNKVLSEQKNTHMTHVEDQVLYGGVKGTRQAIAGLSSLLKMLEGHQKGDVSVKWDGAPAIFAGTDPSDGKFFVAKKGIFNKNPKVYKTKADVDADTSGDLNKKMNDALRLLPSIGIKGVIQGDFLYGKDDIEKTKIEGETYTTFHPNTLVYAFPYESSAAKDIRDSEIGIVWHTTYKGDSFENMSASYGVNVKKLKKSKKVWSQDAMLRDMGKKATMSPKETKQVRDQLSKCGKIFQKISGSVLRELEAHPELPQLIEQYNNTFVRKGEMLPDPKVHTVRLQRWLNDKYKKEIDKRKTEKGKGVQREKMNMILSFFSKKNTPSIIAMFELQRNLVLAKITLINKLSQLSGLKAFVRTNKGYRVTDQEGFVCIDKLGGNAVKLVDRMEFSYNNFSPEILKGWQSAGRK